MSKASDSNQTLDRLLEAMPRIAEAVKAFPESVQQHAFDALMAELRGEAPGGATPDKEKEPAARRGRRSKTARQDVASKPKRRAGNPTAVRDLDLAPKGNKSLKEFVQEKQPKSNHDRNVVSVYYLSELHRLSALTVNHVFTCYKDMRWREPGNLANSLALTAHRKRFLDTANLDDIRLTPAGRNHVDHDLPATTKRK